MQIHNFLPVLIQCLKRWEIAPPLDDFMESYCDPIGRMVDDVFENGSQMHAALSELDWASYRKDALLLDSHREEARIRKHLRDVEKVFGFQLKGEVVLFGAFASMDGYARFDQGTHRVFMGVDESHGRGKYLDILEVHELVHVARESRPEVWTGWGLNPKMTHDEFVEEQPVIEHLFGEGFSCAVSEILVPCNEPWHYVYQEEEDLNEILKKGKSVDQGVHREIALGKEGDWGRLYRPSNYKPRLPVFTHYVWAWQWVRRLLLNHADNDPKKLVSVCSKEFVEDALSFHLGEK